MSTIAQIKTAILTLAPEEFQRLKQWIFDVDYQHWDEQLERDVSEGKLDALAAEAIAEFKAGQCREIQYITQPENFGVMTIGNCYEKGN